MNRIETLKAEKDGLDVSEDLVRFAREGWKTLGADDTERLKWVGVFHPSRAKRTRSSRTSSPSRSALSASMRFMRRSRAGGAAAPRRP